MCGKSVLQLWEWNVSAFCNEQYYVLDVLLRAAWNLRVHCFQVSNLRRCVERVVMGHYFLVFVLIESSPNRPELLSRLPHMSHSIILCFRLWICYGTMLFEKSEGLNLFKSFHNVWHKAVQTPTQASKRQEDVDCICGCLYWRHSLQYQCEGKFNVVIRRRQRKIMLFPDE